MFFFFKTFTATTTWHINNNSFTVDAVKKEILLGFKISARIFRTWASAVRQVDCLPPPKIKNKKTLWRWAFFTHDSRRIFVVVWRRHRFPGLAVARRWRHFRTTAFYTTRALATTSLTLALTSLALGRSRSRRARSGSTLTHTRLQQP